MKRKYELDFVGIRLIKEKSIYSEAKINRPMDAVIFLKEEMSLYDREVMYSLNLDQKGKVINVHMVSMGSSNQLIIDPKNIFKAALLSNADSILLMHNHPSGNVNPSEIDIATTKDLYRACRLLGLKLVDHIIVSDDKYFSMKEHHCLS